MSECADKQSVCIASLQWLHLVSTRLYLHVLDWVSNEHAGLSAAIIYLTPPSHISVFSSSFLFTHIAKSKEASVISRTLIITPYLSVQLPPATGPSLTSHYYPSLTCVSICHAKIATGRGWSRLINVLIRSDNSVSVQKWMYYARGLTAVHYETDPWRSNTASHLVLFYQCHFSASSESQSITQLTIV